MIRWLVLLVALTACGDDASPRDASTDPSLDTTDSSIDVFDAEAPPDPDCDPLVPTACALPFPSTFYEIDDATSTTGRRIAFGDTTLPASVRGVRPDRSALERIDGWSTSTAIMAHFPGIAIESFPRPDSIARSLEPDSASVILDLTTGERVPHFAEVDRSTNADDSRAFILRPVVPLDHDAHYAVGIRMAVDEAGAPLPISSAFAALRDGTDHPHPSVDARRAEYDQVFAALETAGMPRAALQLAWSFHTRSLENVTGEMLHMRDETWAALGDAQPAYRITGMVENPSENVRLRIEGMLEVPLYLDDPGPGGAMTRGPDDLPEAERTTEFPFLVLVPPSATPAEPAAMTQFGHGLFGTREQAEGHTTFANTYNHVLFAMDWVGMASEDVAYVAALINDERPERFERVVDRLRQGVLNKLLVARLMLAIADDPVMLVGGERIVDTAQRYYFGESQGGIFGATLMALTNEIERGGLRVPGQPYSLLLPRSVDFEPYFLLLRFHYDDGIDTQILLALAQLFWDVVEPGTYSRFIRDPLPDTRTHEVVLHIALGDHQVHELGAHHMARAIGAQVLEPAPRSIWGLDDVASPHAGSAIVEFDFRLPPVPIDNVPPSAGDDPHGDVKNLDAAQRQLDVFFRTGEVTHVCDGVCDPE